MYMFQKMGINLKFWRDNMEIFALAVSIISLVVAIIAAINSQGGIIWL